MCVYTYIYIHGELYLNLVGPQSPLCLQAGRLAQRAGARTKRPQQKALGLRKPAQRVQRAVSINWGSLNRELWSSFKGVWGWAGLELILRRTIWLLPYYLGSILGPPTFGNSHIYCRGPTNSQCCGAIFLLYMCVHILCIQICRYVDIDM